MANSNLHQGSHYGRRQDGRRQDGPSGIARQERLAALNELLAPAGVTVGTDHSADVQILAPRALEQILRRGSLGAGEAYMRGWWDATALDDCFFRIIRNGLDGHFRSWRALWLTLRAWLSNPQRPSRAFAVGEAHYDLGNELFEAMLDTRMVYSCGYWARARTVDEAQVDKLELICRKLDLRPGQRLLDIGCGWGSLCRYAAEHFGVEAVGITVSREQQALAREHCRGLPVDIRLLDYRDLPADECFDHAASVGMLEHVGEKNYGTLFHCVRQTLKPDGLFLLHTIGSNRSSHSTDPWIDRYIFPGGQLPSLRQLANAVEGHFVVEDIHNFGADYDPTLRAWFANFDAAWPGLARHYDETFYRMWKYYLLTCAGAFRARALQLWQLLLSPRGALSGYRRERHQLPL